MRALLLLLLQSITSVDAFVGHMSRLKVSPVSRQRPTSLAAEKASKRDMLSFAVPALGIYLTDPLLSNIDNAFVGRTVGVTGLAALSPATMCIDQFLYLFKFLSRATTGIVSRAYANDKNNTEAVAEAGSAPLTVAFVCGSAVSMIFAFLTPRLLAGLHVDAALVPAASSYVYWRGATAWATMAQSVCLSILMATKDAMTPLKIVSLAALLNVVADTLFCVWPGRLGCAGAAAATSLATLVSCGFMVDALRRKSILPRLKLPRKAEVMGLLEFTGPLLAITLTRLAGFIAMQRTAMRLGVQSLAGYQLCFNLLIFFLLFGEPLSQLSQTELPSLIDQKQGPKVVATLQSVAILAAMASCAVAGVSFAAASLGSSLFSSDLGVQAVAKATSPSIFIAVATAVFTVSIDGAMLASKDFGFMLTLGLSTFMAQLYLLPSVTSVAGIFHTFTLRLACYSVMAMARWALGFGAIGRVIRESREPMDEKTVVVS